MGPNELVKIQQLRRRIDCPMNAAILALNKTHWDVDLAEQRLKEQGFGGNT